MTRIFWRSPACALLALWCMFPIGIHAGPGHGGSHPGACDCPHGIELVSPAWVRFLPPGLPNTAAYMTLRNLTDRDFEVVAAESPAAHVTELHDHVQDRAGIMRMRQVESIVIPANGEVELKPGGLHVMLIGLLEPLRDGQLVPITLSAVGVKHLRVHAIVRRADGGDADVQHQGHAHPHGAGPDHAPARNQ